MKAIIALSLFICAGTAHSFEGQDAYGPGVHSDATGRAYSFDPSPNGSKIRRDAYGLGVDMDEAGRAVKRRARWAPDLPLLFRERGGDSTNNGD